MHSIGALRDVGWLPEFPHLWRKDVGMELIVEGPDIPELAAVNAAADSAQDHLGHRVHRQVLLARHCGGGIDQKKVAINRPRLGDVIGDFLPPGGQTDRQPD